MPGIPDTLVLTLAQASVFCIGWLVVATLMRELRAAALCLGLYSVLDVLSMYLLSTRVDTAGTPSAALLSLALLSGTVADFGSDLFVNRRPRHLRLWAGMLAVGIAGQWLATWMPAPLAWHSLAYHFTLLALLCTPLALFARPLRAEFGLIGLLALLPFALFTVFVALYTLHLLITPGALAHGMQQSAAGGLQTLLPFALSSGLFHLTWFGVMVGRQVATAHRLARFDDLTGTLQRSAFEAELEGALVRARREIHPLSVAFLDVDHFKAINDHGGHHAGDEVLRQLAQLLRTCMRASDHIGRWGGEEFVLLMPNSDRVGAFALLDRLQSAVRDAQMALPAGCAPLSVSIGFASVSDGMIAPLALVDAADRAMYEAKLRGRNTWVDASTMA